MKLGELTAAMPKAKGARTDLTLSSQSEYVIGSAEQDTGKKIGESFTLVTLSN